MCCVLAVDSLTFFASLVQRDQWPVRFEQKEYGTACIHTKEYFRQNIKLAIFPKSRFRIRIPFGHQSVFVSYYSVCVTWMRRAI
jgi:hypothetical protein